MDWIIAIWGGNIISLNDMWFKYLISVILAFIIIPIVTGGYTIGKFLVGIRLMRMDGKKPEPWKYVIRYGLLYIIIMPIAFWATLVPDGGLGIAMWLISAIVYIKFIVDFFATGLKKENKFVYEYLSGISNVSIVKGPLYKDGK